MPKVFSYGSNGANQLIDRLEKKSTLNYNPAVLKDHVRIFAGFSGLWKGAIASVHPLKGSKVKGIVIDITEKELEALDHYEGTKSKFYVRKEIIVKEKIGKRYVDSRCFIYIKSKKEFKYLPSADYCDTIIEMLNERHEKRESKKLDIYGIIDKKLEKITTYDKIKGYPKKRVNEMNGMYFLR